MHTCNYIPAHLFLSSRGEIIKFPGFLKMIQTLLKTNFWEFSTFSKIYPGLSSKMCFMEIQKCCWQYFTVVNQRTHSISKVSHSKHVQCIYSVLYCCFGVYDCRLMLMARHSVSHIFLVAGQIFNWNLSTHRLSSCTVHGNSINIQIQVRKWIFICFLFLTSVTICQTPIHFCFIQVWMQWNARIGSALLGTMNFLKNLVSQTNSHYYSYSNVL